jgi:hypothetical protein
MLQFGAARRNRLRRRLRRRTAEKRKASSDNAPSLVVAEREPGFRRITGGAQRNKKRQQVLGRRMGTRGMRRPALPVEQGGRSRRSSASTNQSRNSRTWGRAAPSAASHTTSPRLWVSPPEARIRTPPGQRLQQTAEPVVCFGIGLGHNRELDHRNVGCRVHEAQRRPGAVIQSALPVDLDAGNTLGDFRRQVGRTGRQVVELIERRREAVEIVNRRWCSCGADSRRSRVPVRGDGENRARSRQRSCASACQAGRRGRAPASASASRGKRIPSEWISWPQSSPAYGPRQQPGRNTLFPLVQQPARLSSRSVRSCSRPDPRRRRSRACRPSSGRPRASPCRRAP